MSYLFFINKILQVSSAQFYDTSSVHCTVCSPLHVKSSSITVYPTSTLLQLPSNPAITTLLSRSLSSLSFVFFALSHYSPHPPTAISLLSMSLYLFFLLVHLVHQIPHLSEIIQYLSFSDWLISLSIMLPRTTYAVAKSKNSFFFTAKYIYNFLYSIDAYACIIYKI